MAAGSLDVGGGVWVEVPGGLPDPGGRGRRRRSVPGGRRGLWRSRWAAIGAAVAVVAGVGGVAISGAANPQLVPSETLITPCRIMDTRSGPANVGPRNTPLAGGETYTIQVTGPNGNCVIPPDADGVVMNVTVVGPQSNGFVTVFPEGAARPTASNLNYTAGQSPVPNQVTVALGVTGQVSFFASGGPVNLVADIAGYTTLPRLSTEQLAELRWDQDLAVPASIITDTSPIEVASDGSTIWVANNGSNTVSQIDPVTNGVVTGITVGSNPTGVAYGAGSIWIASASPNAVTRIDVATSTVVATIPVGAIPAKIAFDGTTIWVTVGADLLQGIDPATDTITSTVILPVNAFPQGVAFDGTDLWVANSGLNSVSRVDPVTGTVIGSVAVAADPFAVAFDGTSVWVTSFSSSTVTRIDPTSGSVAGTVTLPGGSGTAGVAFDGTSVWVTNKLGNSLTRINPVTGTLAATLAVPGLAGPQGIAFDGSNLWVTNTGSNRVAKLRTG